MATIENKNISLFFYVNGSKDYPPGHIISDKFGFTSEGGNTENALYKYSVKDLYNRLSSPRVVSNLYSLRKLDKDVYNGISQSAGVEPMSTMVIDSGSNEGFDKINPNYILDKSTPNARDIYSSILSGNPLAGVNYRRRAFWQKMFTITELLRENQQSITQNVKMTNESSYLTPPSGVTLSLDQKARIVQKTSFVDQLLTLFVADKNTFNTEEVISCKDLRRSYEFSSPSYHDDYNIYDPLSLPPPDAFTGTYENTAQPLWDILNIRYEEQSAMYGISPEHSDRLNWVSFKMSYNLTPDSTEIWNFKVYFIPDSIIDNTTFNQYSVYTYNDSDMDGSPLYASQVNDPGFNKFDNDYANTLATDDTHGRFIMKGGANNIIGSGNSEFDNLVLRKLFDIIKSGDYVGYVAYETLRVTPFIHLDVASGVNVVSWVPVGDMLAESNMTYQKFYIFYKGTSAPSNTVIENQIRSYLLNLHSVCNGQTDNSSGVVYIGHGSSEHDRKMFLSKMYPNLFTVTTIDIIPVINTALSNATDNRFVPEKYPQPITLNKIVTTMRQLAEYSSFVFTSDGAMTGENNVFPVEVFHLGGDFTSNNAANIFKYNFPLLCSTTTTGTNQNPLTSIRGFENYHQRIFNGNSGPSTNVDIFQYILLMLYIKMFVNDSTKTHYNSIGPISITYEHDSNYDGDLAPNLYNVARFSMLGIQFRVFSQRGKHFGATGSGDSLPFN